MKYTIEYRRSVRVRKYETLAIGMLSEFQYKDMTPNEAEKIVRGNVNRWIIRELERLQSEK